MRELRFITKRGPAPVVVDVQVDEDGDVGLHIDGILVGYLSHSTGEFHRIVMSPTEQVELGARGLSFRNSLLAVHP